MLLQRTARFGGLAADDFQDLRAWRWLTVLGLRVARRRSAIVVVPMAFSNAAYLAEIREALSRFEPHLLHFCLVAPVDVVHSRLRSRGADSQSHAWEYRRATECCAVHDGEGFAMHIDAANQTPDEIADDLLSRISTLSGAEAA